jgi:hypothetical protein
MNATIEHPPEWPLDFGGDVEVPAIKPPSQCPLEQCLDGSTCEAGSGGCVLARKSESSVGDREKT